MISPISICIKWIFNLRKYFKEWGPRRATSTGCAHVMTVLWYLGFARYQAEIPRPENRLNEFVADLDLSDEDTDSE